FGTLLSSQGTNASFNPVSPGSPGAHSVLRCKLYQTHFQSVSGLNFNPAAACGALPFGCSDFIRFP
ncbi:hypothetical protein, partial [Streptomyces sp. H27-D2]|uniref:hypothetical protein n=1 Tax=Streptomyces sp. H27-D2 TaxID=3046304 RepID=UPI002DBDA24D